MSTIFLFVKLDDLWALTDKTLSIISGGRAVFEGGKAGYIITIKGKLGMRP